MRLYMLLAPLGPYGASFDVRFVARSLGASSTGIATFFFLSPWLISAPEPLSLRRPDLRDRCAAAWLHSQKVNAVLLTTVVLHAKSYYYMYTRLVIAYARSAGRRKFLASIRSHL